jgi:hypothetical protein
MSDWFYNLPVVWMALVVLLVTALVTAAIHVTVFALARGGRTPTFKSMSPVMLTPLAVVFGLIIGFLAAQVWSDAGRADSAVTREVGALRAIVVLAGAFPGETEARIRALVRRHIDIAVNEEWPAMARQSVTVTINSDVDTEALKVILSLTPQNEAQTLAQREMASALQSALEARRERIVISRATINWVKWTVVSLLAVLILVTIALVHSDNSGTAAIAMTIFATSAAACVVLIASHNRPFTGDISIRPQLFLQVMPKE